MKPNIEEIPVVVFEWIANMPFEALKKEMQAEVLNHLTKKEYNTLHQTHGSISKTLQVNPVATSRKSELLNLFDETHQNRRPRLTLQSDMIWKAASILLLFSTLWFAHHSKKTQGELGVHIAEKVDTLIKEVPSIVYQTVRDTIYLKQALESKPKRTLANAQGLNERKEHRTIAASSKAEYVSTQSAVVDVQILTLSSMDKVSNTSRRNSMNDDSLERNFKFVSL